MSHFGGHALRHRRLERGCGRFGSRVGGPTSPAGTTVAAIFPDGPQRYFDTVYNDEYCREHGLLDRRPAADPLTLAHSGQKAVDSWTRCAAVTAPTPVGR